jgi:hypothetical protein
MARPEKSTEQKFAEYINKESGKYFNGTQCWEWQGPIDKDGYGKLSIRRNHVDKHWRAHRWVYSLFKTLQEDDLDHLCKNIKCVNPDHLEHVDARTNNVRSDGPSGINFRKTHCIRDHEFTKQNTYYDRRGWRQCKTCSVLRMRKIRAIKCQTN